MSLLKLQVIGNLTKDAVVNTANSKTVVNFIVAVNEKYRDVNNVEINNTKYIECAYWSEKTAVAQYIKKGGLIYVEGNPSVDTYTNNESKTIPKLKLRVTNIQLLGSSQNNQQQVSQNNNTSSGNAAFDKMMSDNDDVAFNGS